MAVTVLALNSVEVRSVTWNSFPIESFPFSCF